MTPPLRRSMPDRQPNPYAAKRRTAARPERTRILIVGEGQETEPNYIEKLAEEPRIQSLFTLTVKPGHGKSQDAVLMEAIEHKKKGTYDETWCIVDTEGESKAANLTKAFELAREHNIKIWLSNPAMEIWFLQHLERKADRYGSAKAALSELERLWKKRFNSEYDKADESVYKRLRGLLTIGIDNAAWALENHHRNMPCRESNSSTELYKAVLRLLPEGTFDTGPVRLSEGTIVPDFRIMKHDGRYCRMTDLRGRIVVLFFHAGINRGTNAAVAASLRTTVQSLDTDNVDVFAVSSERSETLKEAYGLGEFPTLLSDEDGAVGAKWGFPTELVPVGRPQSEVVGITFVVGRDGVLIKSLLVEEPAAHASDVLLVLKDLAGQ